ncbi:MAG: GNAT family N-acetyltransferase [Geminicoccales bacterium]
MLTIRPGRPEDAPSLAKMISDFNVEEGSPGRIDAQAVGDLCFSPTSSYRAYVADDGETLTGYALVTPYFDTEPCAWCSYMQDLFVVEGWRSQGIGRRLIAAVAKAAMEQQHHELLWHVRDNNKRGRAFYTSIGGEEQTPIPVILKDKSLERLATEV